MLALVHVQEALVQRRLVRHRRRAVRERAAKQTHVSSHPSRTIAHCAAEHPEHRLQPNALSAAGGRSSVHCCSTVAAHAGVDDPPSAVGGPSQHRRLQLAFHCSTCGTIACSAFGLGPQCWRTGGHALCHFLVVEDAPPPLLLHMAHIVPARGVLAAVQCGQVDRMRFVRSPTLHY